MFISHKEYVLDFSSCAVLFYSSEADYLRYACDIVSDYIDDSLKNQLLTKLGLPVPTESERLKRKNEGVEDDEGRKKLKGTVKEGNGIMPLEDYGSNKLDSSNAANSKVCVLLNLHKSNYSRKCLVTCNYSVPVLLCMTIEIDVINIYSSILQIGMSSFPVLASSR